MKGTIYMIPCPIADTRPLWDVLPRANYEVMNSLDYFIVENVRSARRFLAKAGVERRIEELEFVELNEHTTKPEDVERMLRPGCRHRSLGASPRHTCGAVGGPLVNTYVGDGLGTQWPVVCLRGLPPREGGRA